MVQYSFTSTETRKLVRTDSPGRPPRLSHSSWTMRWRQRCDRYIISLSPYLRTPSPFSLSLISLMVSVDVKHHAYLLTNSALSRSNHFPRRTQGYIGYYTSDLAAHGIVGVFRPIPKSSTSPPAYLHGHHLGFPDSSGLKSSVPFCTSSHRRFPVFSSPD